VLLLAPRAQSGGKKAHGKKKFLTEFFGGVLAAVFDFLAQTVFFGRDALN
jgi:hypothetical protein